MFIRTSRVSRPEERQTSLNRVFNRLIGEPGCFGPTSQDSRTRSETLYRDRAARGRVHFLPAFNRPRSWSRMVRYVRARAFASSTAVMQVGCTRGYMFARMIYEVFRRICDVESLVLSLSLRLAFCANEKRGSLRDVSLSRSLFLLSLPPPFRLRVPRGRGRRPRSGIRKNAEKSSAVA